MVVITVAVVPVVILVVTATVIVSNIEIIIQMMHGS